VSARNASPSAWRAALRKTWAKPALGLLLLAPLAYLVWAALTDALGPNPAEALIWHTGELALRMLCLTLAITPLRVLSGVTELARFRRMCGLIAYTYAVLHLLSYSGFDMGFEWADIGADILKRPFIWMGMLTFVLLSALAVTSFNAAIRWLGAARWQALHRLVYAAAIGAMVHFYWKRAGKHHFDEVWVYGGIVAALLMWRLWRRLHSKRSSAKVSNADSRSRTK
jgi:sulfoxide reductase heme-binding subunit YedZ